jgi:hypothetical protein
MKKCYVVFILLNICLYAKAHIAFTHNGPTKLTIFDLTIKKTYTVEVGALQVLETRPHTEHHFLFFEDDQSSLDDQLPIASFATPSNLPRSPLISLNTQDVLTYHLPDTFSPTRELMTRQNATKLCAPQSSCSRCAARKQNR